MVTPLIDTLLDKIVAENENLKIENAKLLEEIVTLKSKLETAEGKMKKNDKTVQITMDHKIDTETVTRDSMIGSEENEIW